MELEVFPDMLGLGRDPTPIDPAIAAMDLSPAWSGRELLIFLNSDIAATIEHAGKLTDHLPEDKRLLFQLLVGNKIVALKESMDKMAALIERDLT